MKEHPDYKYRPRRKPKTGLKKESPRYSFSMETSHVTPPLMNAGQHHGHVLPSFSRPLFSPDLLPPAIPSTSSSSVDSKSVSERAELNYSRLLFASQIPSLHLGFATLGHPLHTVQIPWYHYNMDSNAFNPLLHHATVPKRSLGHHASVESHSSAHKMMRSVNQSILSTSAATHHRQSPTLPHAYRRSSVFKAVKTEKTSADDRLSPSSSDVFNRAASPATSYSSTSESVEGRQHNHPAPVTSTPSAEINPVSGGVMTFPMTPPSLPTGMFPFPYGSPYPATSFGCNCGPICLLNHDNH